MKKDDWKKRERKLIIAMLLVPFTAGFSMAEFVIKEILKGKEKA